MNFDHYTIKPIALSDAEAFFQLVENNKDRISTYFPGIVTKTTSLEETKAHISERIEGAEKGGYMICLIIDKPSDSLVGTVQLKEIDTNAQKREIGFFIDSHSENKGIGTKSILAVSRYCFNVLNLNKVFMRIAEENTPSRRVAEKCGFVIEGVLRNDFMTTDGQLMDIFYYGLLKSELN